LDLVSADLEQHLPQLQGTAYKLTSPKTRNYNCVAWAAGDDARWWWPSPVAYWPVANVSETVAAFVDAFGTLGQSGSLRRRGTTNSHGSPVAQWSVDEQMR
jgi:hypothetical protein